MTDANGGATLCGMKQNLTPDPAEDEQQREGDAAEVREGPPPATTGSSPSHRAESGSQTGPLRDETQRDAIAEKPKAVDELSMADSLILEVLRGWRLMQASGLTADERRDILASTKNSMKYTVIALALQNVWDDQLLGRSGPAHGQLGSRARLLPRSRG